MPKGSKIVAKYAHDVVVWSYPASIDGKPVTSFEVHHRRKAVQRFLHIDLGEMAGDLARSFACGFASALARRGGR